MKILTRPKRKIKSRKENHSLEPIANKRRETEAPDCGIDSSEQEAPDAGERRINVFEGDFTHGRSQS